jgi:hypothetical protein
MVGESSPSRCIGAFVEVNLYRDGETKMQQTNSHEQEPIKIVGVIEEDVAPRIDNHARSTLYEIPFRLSRQPSEPWSEFFVDAWNRPSEFTSMHRPGIARVEGDRIVLDGTTIEEVERYHLKTLKLAIDRANELTLQWGRSKEQREKALSEQQETLRHHVREVAKRLKFD